MKCLVVLDEGGKIVSIAYMHRPELESHAYLTPRCGPVIKDGQVLVELDVPSDYAKLPLVDFTERLHVEAKTKMQKIKQKK